MKIRLHDERIYCDGNQNGRHTDATNISANPLRVMMTRLLSQPINHVFFIRMSIRETQTINHVFFMRMSTGETQICQLSTVPGFHVVYPRLSTLIYTKGCNAFVPRSDCIYHSPTDLEPNGRPFGFRSIGKW